MQSKNFYYIINLIKFKNLNSRESYKELVYNYINFTPYKGYNKWKRFHLNVLCNNYNLPLI